MGSRVSLALACLLGAVALAACGPFDGAGGGEHPQPEASDTAAPAAAPAACRGRIAFAGRDGGERDIFVVDVASGALSNVTRGEGPERSPAWSPDGDRIAFVRYVGNADIYTIGAGGEGLLRVTELPSTEYAPAWSPDGEYLIYGSTAGYASEIWLAGAEGGSAEPLTDSAAHKPDFSWSPGGTHILYTELDSYNQGDIFVLTAPGGAGAGRDPLNLTQHPAHDCCAAWSPDGSRILFLSSRDGQAGGGLLAKPLAGEQGAGSRPSVAEGGEAGATGRPVVRAITTVMPEPVRDIYAVGPAGDGLTRLTSGPGRARDASWSPEGSRVAFVSDRDGNDEIYLLAVTGGVAAGELARLTSSPDDKAYPAWAPDGTCLAFLSDRDGSVGLYLMDANGGGLHKLAGGADRSSWPVWSP